MNSLSWLLYLADVCDSLDTSFAALAIVSGIASGIGVIAYFVSGAIGAGDDDASCLAVQKVVGKGLQYALPGFLSLLLLGALIPEKETFYAIAASEMGEQVLESKTASKAQAALDAWLDKQIAGTQPQPQPETSK